MRSSMRSIVGVLRIAVLVAAVVALSPHAGRATGDRDFAGFYEATNPVDQGTDVQISFAARVFNYGDADVVNGTAKLCDSSVPDVAYGTFSNVNIAQGQNASVRGTITLPRREFDWWQQADAGGGPSLWIEFTDAGGNSVRARVELVSAPVGEDN